MKFLTNLYNPEIYKKEIIRIFGETQEQANNNFNKWLKDKIIGKPQATNFYTVEELENRNIVGIYEKNE